MKEYKLYNKLLDKINPEIELSVSRPSSKDRPAIISILPILILSIQNNYSPYFSSFSLSYKYLSLLLSLMAKMTIAEIDNINYDVEI